MRLGDFVAYLGGARRDRVLNVISLEFSDTRWVMSYPAGDLSSMSWYLPVCPSIPQSFPDLLPQRFQDIPGAAPAPRQPGDSPPPPGPVSHTTPQGVLCPQGPSQYVPVPPSNLVSQDIPHLPPWGILGVPSRQRSSLSFPPIPGTPLGPLPKTPPPQNLGPVPPTPETPQF